MGRTINQRLVRKLELKIALSKVAPHPSPKAHLEQYTITPEVAAEILYLAAYTYGDVVNKKIIDLGCGTGRLAIGGALLGAQETVGVDIDSNAVEVALTSAEKLNIKEKTQWITADIAAVQGKFDTVLQNPPFGVQRKKADREFLEKALEVGKKIYSLHKSTRDISGYRKTGKQNIKSLPSSPSRFLKQFIKTKGGQINSVHTLPIIIPHMFKFHRKQKHRFYVDLYVIKRA